MHKQDVLQRGRREQGIIVHIYRWGAQSFRKQLNRYKKEGLMTREVWGDYFIFRTKNAP